MKIALFILCFLSITIGLSQPPKANQLLGITTASQAEINAITNPIEGSLIYNTDDKLLYQYNGSAWSKRSSEGNETIITAAGHTDITGTGTSIDPYIASSILSTFTSNPDGSFTFSNGVDEDVIFIPVTPANQPLVTDVVLEEGICAHLGINETRDIVIQGAYFNGSSLVNIPGQTINSIIINSNTQLTANITSGSTAGNFDVTVSNNIGNGTLVGALLIEDPSVPSTNSISIPEMILIGAITYDGTTLKKTAAGVWDAQGYSLNHAISSAGGKLEFTIDQANRNTMVGLSYDPAKTSFYTNLNYGVYLTAGAQIQIREEGSSLGYVATYIAGDILSIEKDCQGKVTYYLNGTLLYTSSTLALGPLYFNTSVYTSNSSISNIAITY